MRFTMKEKKIITKAVAMRYFRADKKQKGVMLDEFVKITHYNRSYAARVLRNTAQPKNKKKKEAKKV